MERACCQRILELVIQHSSWPRIALSDRLTKRSWAAERSNPTLTLWKESHTYGGVTHIFYNLNLRYRKLLSKKCAGNTLRLWFQIVEERDELRVAHHLACVVLVAGADRERAHAG